MCAVFAIALLTRDVGSIVLFALISFFALREFITLTPTRHGDHRTLLWVFFVVMPIQYWLVWNDWYGLFAIFIPVFVFLLVPTRSALAGDTERFLERTATIQWALMICVYCVSYAPALLTLEIPGYDEAAPSCCCSWSSWSRAATSCSTSGASSLGDTGSRRP